MKKPVLEFSRPVALVHLGAEPFRAEIAATAEECAGLARRFGLVALDRLAAIVTLRREAGDRVRLDASFEAEFAQNCVVTLEPVPGRLATDFALLYGPAADAPPEDEIDFDGPAFEPLDGDAIDIGEAVAQELSLALPEFPRDPDAALELPAEEPAPGPLAGLGKLRPPPQ